MLQSLEALAIILIYFIQHTHAEASINRCITRGGRAVSLGCEKRHGVEELTRREIWFGSSLTALGSAFFHPLYFLNSSGS